MSTGAQSSPRLLQDQEILGELLHSVSQPLTTLCCSLELSIGKAAGQQQEAVAAALEQAERVIGQVRLLREYLDAELLVAATQPVAIAPVLRDIVEALSSVAALEQVDLKVVGTSPATIAIATPRLRLALQYLLGALVEMQAPGSVVSLRFEEREAEALLHGIIAAKDAVSEGVGRPAKKRHDAAGSTSRKIRLAIAARILESGGASLTLGTGGSPGFVLRIPRYSLRPV